MTFTKISLIQPLAYLWSDAACVLEQGKTPGQLNSPTHHSLSQSHLEAIRVESLPKHTCFLEYERKPESS